MLKPIFAVAATGVVAALLWKILLIPLVGIATGFLFLVIKIVFWGVMICIAIWLLRRWTRREETLA